MIRREGENQDLVEVSVDVSQKEQGQKKKLVLFTPKNPTVDLTATSNDDTM